MGIKLFLLALALWCTDGMAQPPPVPLHETQPLAGTLFSIDLVTRDPVLGRQAMTAAFAEVARLESIVSEWQPDSEISIINARSGPDPMSLSAELFGVINRALWFASITGGAFDPSFAGCAALWSIPERRIPGDSDIAACRQLTGYRHIRLDAGASSIRLDLPGMRIGLGGISKGYRVDRAAEVLESHGVSSYVVNGGGDIRVSAGALRGPWHIDIAHPRADGRSLGGIRLGRGAIATSGDSSWYFDRDGVRYHHIFDPRTGGPARRSVAVTVIAERAIDADAMATGLFVMGPERSLALLGEMPGYEALMVGQDFNVYRTAGFPPISEPEQGEP